MARTKAAPEAPVGDPVDPVVDRQPVEPAEPKAPVPAAEERIAAEPEMVKARVLVACAHGQPDDVVEIDAELAKTLRDVLDTTPAAVEYAESLK